MQEFKIKSRTNSPKVSISFVLEGLLDGNFISAVTEGSPPSPPNLKFPNFLIYKVGIVAPSTVPKYHHWETLFEAGGKFHIKINAGRDRCSAMTIKQS